MRMLYPESGIIVSHITDIKQIPLASNTSLKFWHEMAMHNCWFSADPIPQQAFSTTYRFIGSFRWNPHNLERVMALIPPAISANPMGSAEGHNSVPNYFELGAANEGSQAAGTFLVPTMENHSDSVHQFLMREAFYFTRCKNVVEGRHSEPSNFSPWCEINTRRKIRDKSIPFLLLITSCVLRFIWAEE